MIISSTLFYGYNLQIEGYVVSNASQEPIANQLIEISIDTLQGGAFYYSVVYTDSNGYYNDNIQLDDSVTGTVMVITDSCDFFAYRENYFSPNNTTISNDFQVCDPIISSCYAFYTFWSTGDQYTIQFLDNSFGSINSWLWDFGDGNFSQEQNPIHTFPQPGEYITTLTIEGDSCFDFYQAFILIVDDTIQDCEAYFTYEQSNLDPLTINFTDLSSGNPTSWFWDFGDGNFSFEQNPTHNYPYQGNYMVSLTIFNADSCSDTFVRDVWVMGDTVSCDASFTYILDTLNNTPHTFNFFDESSGNISNWIWDFGDGNFSSEQNPVHTYSDGGDYTVCLTVITEETGTACVSDTCLILQTMEYFDFGGQVFAGDYPINIDSTDNDNIANVHLYRKIDNSWYYMDSRQFWKYGYYWFANKPRGQYLLLTEIEESSTIYNDYAPTYYPGSYSWKGAGTFDLNNSEQFAVNINLNKLATMDAGTNKLSGYVFAGLSCFQSDLIDVSNVLVQLLNSNNQIVDFTYSDTTGYYEFTNIGNGIYNVRAEYPGKYSETYPVSFIDVSLPIEQNLEVHCNHILGIENIEQTNTINVKGPTPNPADNRFSIKVTSYAECELNVMIQNLSGNILYDSEYSLVQGTNSILIQTNNLDSGYYLVIVTDKSSNYTSIKKLIIIK